MKQIKGYNRNLCGGRRPHRKIQKYGKYLNLAERLKAETKALNEYLIRTHLKKDLVD